MKVEYRVKTVERYIVTRYEEDANGAAVAERGHYTSPHIAYEVAYALAKAEHERLGYPLGDMRIIYPDVPMHLSGEPAHFVTAAEERIAASA
jgi:hypothetical protein